MQEYIKKIVEFKTRLGTLAGLPSGLAQQITLINASEEMDDIMKIVKSLKESGLLNKGVSETIRNETKEQKSEFLSMLFFCYIRSWFIRRES